MKTQLVPSTVRAAVTLWLSFHCLASAQTLLYQFDGDQSSDRFGRSVDSAGDVDGDGHDDIVVGVHEDAANGLYNAGTVRVYSGVDGALLYTFLGSAANDHFGWAVSGAGDVDADGHDDIVASATPTGGATSNYVRVYSGVDGSLIYQFSGSASGWFGFAVGTAGDVDLDGHDDILIGIPQPTGTGSVQVRSGAIGFTLFAWNGDAIGDGFGYSVGGGGDANGDRWPEVIVGAPQFGAGAGYARVFSTQFGFPLWTSNGYDVGDWFGVSVALDHDVTGDGLDDAVVGSPEALSKAGLAVGRASIFSGPAGLLTRSFGGLAEGDDFGESVATADFDWDGFADVLVGAPGDDTVVENAGSATLFSGATGGVIDTVYGTLTRDGLGTCVASAGQVDTHSRPLYEDIVVGAPGRGEVLYPGYVRVFAGDEVPSSPSGPSVQLLPDHLIQGLDVSGGDLPLVILETEDGRTQLLPRR